VPRKLIPLLAVAAALLAAAPAAAAKRTIHRSPHLWATVNVCDTAASPNVLGIRGSMPGSGRRREDMWMRFQAQYFRESDRSWHNIRSGADSGFMRVGSARFKARQAGWRFSFSPPGRGRFLLRGVVTFEWRVKSEVVRRARKRTEGGHKSSAGADPPGYSASVCQIR